MKHAEIQAHVRELARRASDLFSPKPHIKGKLAVVKDIALRGYMEYRGNGSYSWHPDYQLPESPEHQFRLNQAHGFYDGKRLVGYWGEHQRKSI